MVMTAAGENSSRGRTKTSYHQRRSSDCPQEKSRSSGCRRRKNNESSRLSESSNNELALVGATAVETLPASSAVTALATIIGAVGLLYIMIAANTQKNQGTKVLKRKPRMRCGSERLSHGAQWCVVIWAHRMHGHMGLWGTGYKLIRYDSK